MRAKVVGVVALVALAAAAAVVATAARTATSANGLPSYTNGYEKWPKLNRKPIRTDRLGAHSGVKNVYASKKKQRGKFPNGTVVVKTIVKPGTGYIGQFAVMRKVKGKWGYIEYTRSSARQRYTVLAKGQLCSSCHQLAKKTDYVFTTR